MFSQPNPGLPIFEVTSEGIFSNSGDFTIGLQFYKAPLFSLSMEDLATFQRFWVKAMRPLGVNVILHILDWYTSQSYTPDPDPDTVEENYLKQASKRHFHERPYRDHRCYCFVTLPFPGKKPSTSAFSSLFQWHFLPEYTWQPKLLQDFQDRCQQFEHILSDSKVLKTRRLSRDELVSSPQKRGIIEQYLMLSSESDLTLRDITLKPEIRVGDRHCILYTLADAELLPSQCSSSRYEPYSTDNTIFPIGFATQLGPLLDADHIYSQYIFLDNPQQTLSQLETRLRRLQGFASHSRDNAVAADAIQKYLQEAAESQALPIKFHANVLAWCYNQGDIKDLRLKVSSLISRMGAVPRLETAGAPQIWWAGIPGNAASFPMNDSFPTFAEQAACFLIPESNDRSSASPVGLRLCDRHTKCPLHVDISDAPLQSHYINNRNKFVLGGSGSGKSFFINLLVLCYFEQGSHIVLIDVGGSYKGLCQLLGGLYLAYEEKSPICFNPFRLEAGDYPDTEKKESLINLVYILWKKGDEPFSRSEYISLSNAVHQFYRDETVDSGDIPSFNSFYDFLQGSYSHALQDEKITDKDFDLENLLYVLKPYYKGGEYDYLLNAMDQPSLLHEQLIVFEIDAIKDHPILFPVVTVIIMETFVSKMRKLKGIRKIVILEEAWKALAKEGMSEYIKYLFKTVRKFFGEAIVVTQDIEDIISSPIVKNSIINNADCKILLDQSKFVHRFQQIQDLFGLTEKDKTMVLSLNKNNDPTKKYKEVFIGFANGPSKVYGVEVSLEEYLVFTTEEREKEKVSGYSYKYGSLRKGVAALAADLRAGVVQLLLTAAFTTLFLLAPAVHANAQIFDLIDAAIKKALVVADLRIQRLQTQTLLLQNAQKTLENTMQDGLLGEITSWVDRQEQLYSSYFQELWQVKSALSSFGKVSHLISRQAQLVKDYQQVWSLIQSDVHFSPSELAQIGSIYQHLLNESSRTIGELTLVIKSFATQMDDASRLRIIDETNDRIEHNYTELKRFTQENALLSMQRSRNQQEIEMIKKLYGI